MLEAVDMGDRLEPFSLVFFFLSWLLLWIPWGIWLGYRLGWAFPQPPRPEQKIPLVLSLYVFALPLLGLLTCFGHHPWSDYGSSWTLTFGFGILTGLGLALLSLALLWGLAWSLGWITFTLDPDQLLKTAPLVLAIALFISGVEEIVFRGFVPVSLPALFSYFGIGSLGEIGSLGGWGIVAIANLLFALLHFPWDRWQNVVPQLPGLWLLGMVLSLAYARQGNLGLAIGLHGGWVWAIASLDTLQAIQPTGKVPAWVTGMGGYLLAGIMGLVFLALVGVGLARL